MYLSCYPFTRFRVCFTEDPRALVRLLVAVYHAFGLSILIGEHSAVVLGRELPWSARQQIHEHAPSYTVPNAIDIILEEASIWDAKFLCHQSSISCRDTRHSLGPLPAHGNSNALVANIDQLNRSNILLKASSSNTPMQGSNKLFSEISGM